MVCNKSINNWSIANIKNKITIIKTLLKVLYQNPIKYGRSCIEKAKEFKANIIGRKRDREACGKNRLRQKVCR